MPKVSVLLPVYNAELYLEEAARSILGQTLADFELILIDDGSTDRSFEIMKALAHQDDRVVLAKNKYTKGVAGALNTGLDLAQADYIARMDSDDISLSQRLATQVAYLDHHPQVYILGSYYEAFDGKALKKVIKPVKTSAQIAWQFVSVNQICHPSVMFRREVATKFGGYPYEVAEDYAFFSMAIREYRAFNLPQVLLKFRVHSSSVTKVNETGVGGSAVKTSQQNYAYYLGNLDHYEQFVSFQRREVVRFRNLPLCLSLSFRVIRQIRQDYKLSVLGLLPVYWLVLVRLLQQFVAKIALLF